MFEHNNTKTYEELIGLESDKRLLAEQNNGDGREEDMENLDSYDEEEVDDELKLDDKEHHDEDEEDLEVGDGVGLGDEWGEHDEEDIEAGIKESEHAEL